VGHDKGLANDVSALQVSKACLNFTSCDELLRQSDLVVEGYIPYWIHEPLSIESSEPAVRVDGREQEATYRPVRLGEG
jgi:hypothetical protein